MEQCESSSYPIRTVVSSGFLLLFVSCFGLLGNSVCVTMLIRKYFLRSVFRVYLTTLCVADSITLLCSLVTLTVPVLAEFFCAKPDLISIISYITVFFYPVGLMAEGGSTLTTAAISLVRFISVKYPMETGFLGKRHIARCIIATISMATFLINLPRLLELKLSACETFDGDRNVSVYLVAQTSLRLNSAYKTFYLFYFYSICMFFLPFITILACNLSIAAILVKSAKQDHWLARHGGVTTQNELMATKLIVFLCFLFLSCHSLPVIVNFIEANFSASSETYSIMVDVSNLLVVAKASGNFLVYMSFNRKFRKSLLNLKFLTMLRSNGNHMYNLLFPKRHPRAPLCKPVKHGLPVSDSSANVNWGSNSVHNTTDNMDTTTVI